jgi:hypothetical protein
MQTTGVGHDITNALDESHETLVNSVSPLGKVRLNYVPYLGWLWKLGCSR